MNFPFVDHPSPSSQSSYMLKVIIGVSVAIVTIAVVIAVCLNKYFLKRKKMERRIRRSSRESAQGEAESIHTVMFPLGPEGANKLIALIKAKHNTNSIRFRKLLLNIKIKILHRRTFLCPLLSLNVAV